MPTAAIPFDTARLDKLMDDAGRGAADWPAYLRMLDRIDPSYRS